MPAAWDVAVAQIEAADLPCPVYRSARRLLDRAAGNDGVVALNDADLRVICQSEAEGTLRSHLIQMQTAGILNYSRRTPRHGNQEAMIFIQFEAWATAPLPIEDANGDEIVKKMIDQRSNLIDQRSFSESVGDAEPPIVKEMIDQRSFTRAQRSNLIDQRSFSASTSHARSGWVGGSLINSKPSKKKKPTHPPLPSQTPQPPEAEQLALGLLIDPDVGVSYQVAQILAASMPLVDIYRVVDEWLPERKAGKVQAGALVSRLRSLAPSDAETVTLSADFRSSDLFQRHRLPDDLLAAPRDRRYNRAEDYTDIDLDYEQRRRRYRPDEYSDIILG